MLNMCQSLNDHPIKGFAGKRWRYIYCCSNHESRCGEISKRLGDLRLCRTYVLLSDATKLLKSNGLFVEEIVPMKLIKFCKPAGENYHNENRSSASTFSKGFASGLRSNLSAGTITTRFDLHRPAPANSINLFSHAEFLALQCAKQTARPGDLKMRLRQNLQSHFETRSNQLQLTGLSFLLTTSQLNNPESKSSSLQCWKGLWCYLQQKQVTIQLKETSGKHNLHP